jgi:1,2-diacylglycerol-3-alpha-glucose alpha-1,2-glucosyltransferase
VSVQQVRIAGVTRRPFERPRQAQSVAFGDAPSAADVPPGSFFAAGLDGLASERLEALDPLAGDSRLVRHWRYWVGGGKMPSGRASNCAVMVWVLREQPESPETLGYCDSHGSLRSPFE